MNGDLVLKDGKPRPRATPRVGISLDRSGGANQADTAGADINKIVAQYKKSGTLPRVATSNPLFGDFTFPEDIHSMREAVFQAEDRFNRLPADVRTLCDNDWVQFMDRFDDPEARQGMVDVGLLVQDMEPTPEPEAEFILTPTPNDPAPIPNNSPSPKENDT